jgi:hypothetical protein
MFSSALKATINRVLARANIRLDTLTAERAEGRRLDALEQKNYFEQPAFPLPPGFDSLACEPVLEKLQQYQARFDSWMVGATNDTGYTFDNGFYSSPDAEVLYAITCMLRPRRIVEVGSGNSTRLFRQAILDKKI